MNYYNFVHDFDEVNKFIDLLDEPKNDECYVLSLSARKKYLNEEEQKYLKLKGKEMFLRQIVNLKSDYLRHIKRYSSAR